MKDILVSIITVSFNSEKTIKRTIESVLNQSYQNIEYLIIDGASTDNTLQIIKSYEKAFDGRLKLVSEPDNGIYDAMNKGIRLAKGELIGIINSDDYYEMTAVQDMVDSLKEDDPYQILYGFLKKINNGVVTQILMTRHENIRNVMIPHPTCFITKKLYDDVGMYDTKYRSCADYEFALRMSKNPRVHFVPVYKVISTFDDGGMSSKYSSQKETLKMRKEYGLVTKKQYLFGRIKLFVKRVVG